MNKQTLINMPLISNGQEDIVALWQRSIRGEANARKALLQRIMPGNARTADILPFAAPQQQPVREAA